MKSITAREGALQIRELFYPEVPKTQEDADRVKFAVYSTKGVRGVFTSLDDTAAVVHAGFWEEALDFRDLYKSLTELKAQEDDANHTIYITGLPWLYTSVLQYTQPAALHLRPHLPHPGVPALHLLPHLDGHLGAGALRHPVERLGSRLRRRARVQLRSAGAGDPDLPHRARPQPLGPVDGPLPRGVLPPARQAAGDHRLVLAPLPAGDVGHRHRRHRPAAWSPWRRSR